MTPDRAPERVVVVGTSVGGIRTGQALRAAGHTGEVIVVGVEDVAPYDKPPLSKQVLVGSQTATDISLLGPDGWAGDGLTPMTGRAAVRLDPGGKQVILSDGEPVDYDAVVLATGAFPRSIPTPQGDLVCTVRELRDAAAIRERFSHGGPVVVVGSGFIGAEVASSARQLGLDVTIVEALPEPFARVLGPEVGERISRLHVDEGVAVLGSAAVARVESLADGTGVVHLVDGRRLPAATVVVGIGVVPGTGWLEGSGLDLESGVLTDEFCRASGAPDVYAVGDVARWLDLRSGEHILVEHWTNAVEQANLVAHNLLNPGELRPHVKAPYFWSDQHGLKIQMVGRIHPEDRVTFLRCTTTAGDKEIALYSHGGGFSAAVVLGWPRAVVACRRAWERGEDLAQITARLTDLATTAAPAPVA